MKEWLKRGELIDKQLEICFWFSPELDLFSRQKLIAAHVDLDKVALNSGPDVSCAAPALEKLLQFRVEVSARLFRARIYLPRMDQLCKNLKKPFRELNENKLIPTFFDQVCSCRFEYWRVLDNSNCVHIFSREKFFSLSRRIWNSSLQLVSFCTNR